MKIRLPFPPKELSPNARLHWAAKSRAVKAYRKACWAAALSQGAKKSTAEAIHCDMTFYTPDKRRYDADGLLARMKSGIDGMADAVGIDDNHWEFTFRIADETGGYVDVILTDVFE